MKYNPNFYFFDEETRTSLEITEKFLLSMENFLKIGIDETELVKKLNYEDLVKSIKTLDEIYHKYLSDYNNFKTGEARSILDLEHIMNLITLGSENLPELDTITLRFCCAICLKNLIQRINNCYLGLILLLKQLYPEKDIKNDIFSGTICPVVTA